MKTNRIEQLKRGVAVFVLVWMSVLSPAVSFAQEATDASGEPTGAGETTGVTEPTGTSAEETGPQTCTGAGCDQGFNQGVDQGTNQGTENGGPTLEELGATQNESGEWVLPEGVENTTQGAAQGTSNGIEATNSNTGADSTNANSVSDTSATNTNVTNAATAGTTANVGAVTGENAADKNTGSANVTTGNAAIAGTSVVAENTVGNVGLGVNGYNGDYIGDLLLAFAGAAASVGNGQSVQAVNDTTGANSTNTNEIATQMSDTLAVQNDGLIYNMLNLAANTGDNSASMNTGNGTVTTGDADVAATLVNFLNTVVDNGIVRVAVQDIFGDLLGNIVLPNLSALAASLFGSSTPTIVASNENTGSGSTNTIDVDLKESDATNVTNNALITTNATADVNTGNNSAAGNTGGASVTTGEAGASLASTTIANTTLQGGNWALVIVNALNGWFGILLGDNGEVMALSQEQTLELANRNTGANSTNTIDVSQERERTTDVTNNAEIVNDIGLSANTGRNEADYNTGEAVIETGDAHAQATVVNVANTVVKDASLFIAVVNIFGDWFGDLLYGGSSLLAAAHSGQVAVDAANSQTGSDSTNTIDVNVENTETVDVDNNAKIATTLKADVNTGGNVANKNTGGASVETGNGLLALHARTIANVTGLVADPALGIAISGLNDTTGFDSTNKIKATLNDQRVISIDNFADVSTLFASLVNTGKNETSYNTLGGSIATGNIEAAGGVENLINRVMLALAGQAGTEIDADFLNHLTGALSENSNEVAVTYDMLVDVLNQGLVNNLFDMLFNTGSNTANYNTGGELSAAAVGGGASITTGSICFGGQVENDVNSLSMGGGLFSLNVDSGADVNTQASIQALTGGNEMIGNTSGGEASGSEPCRVAQAPTPTPTPGPVTDDRGTGGEKHDGGSGGDGDDGDESVVAAAVGGGKPGRVNGGKILRRFPVAGSMVEAQWLAGAKRPVWPAAVLGAISILGLAYHLDQQAKRRRAALTLTR